MTTGKEDHLAIIEVKNVEKIELQKKLTRSQSHDLLGGNHEY